MEAANLLPPGEVVDNMNKADGLIDAMVAAEVGPATDDHTVDHSQAEANKLSDRRQEVRRLIREHWVGEPVDQAFVLAMVGIIDASEIGKDRFGEGMSPETERLNVHEEVIYLRRRNSGQSE